MFGKKTRIIITIQEDLVRAKSKGKVSVKDVENAITWLAESVEKETGIKAITVLSKIIFDMI